MKGSKFAAKNLYPIEVSREKLTQFCCRWADLSRACFGLVNLSISVIIFFESLGCESEAAFGGKCDFFCSLTYEYLFEKI